MRALIAIILLAIIIAAVTATPAMSDLLVILDLPKIIED